MVSATSGRASSAFTLYALEAVQTTIRPSFHRNPIGIARGNPSVPLYAIRAGIAECSSSCESGSFITSATCSWRMLISFRLARDSVYPTVYPTLVDALFTQVRRRSVFGTSGVGGSRKSTYRGGASENRPLGDGGYAVAEAPTDARLPGSGHEPRGDRSELRADRDDVHKGRPRGAGLRALLPHEGAVQEPRAHGAMAGRHAGGSGRLGAGPRRLPGHRGLAGVHVLRRAAGDESRREGHPHGPRPPEVVRERPRHYL